MRTHWRNGLNELFEGQQFPQRDERCWCAVTRRTVSNRSNVLQSLPSKPSLSRNSSARSRNSNAHVGGVRRVAWATLDGNASAGIAKRRDRLSAAVFDSAGRCSHPKCQRWRTRRHAISRATMSMLPFPFKEMAS